MEQDKVRENHWFDPINSSNSDLIPTTLAKPVWSDPCKTPGGSWVCWCCCFSLVVVFNCWRRRVFGNGLCLIVWEEDCLIVSLFSLVVFLFRCFRFCCEYWNRVWMALFQFDGKLVWWTWVWHSKIKYISLELLVS